MTRTEMIVALDIPTSRDMIPLLDMLGDEASFYKVGLELFCAEGPRALEPLKERGKSIFLDLKLHDIPRTVERAVRVVSDWGVDLLTLHASGGPAMLEAAARGAQHAAHKPPALIAVTTLTSLGPEDLERIGIQRTMTEQAASLAGMALSCGLQGVVTSVHEAAALRAQLGPEALIVTPGIRLPSHDHADQKRVATPFDATRAGATHLVVGRPILEAPEPRRAAQAVRSDIRLAQRANA